MGVDLLFAPLGTRARYIVHRTRQKQAKAVSGDVRRTSLTVL